jgi:tetratricopeptide (TPR) repeat protein
MTPSPLNEAMRLANGKLQAGNPAEAERIYRQILLQHSNSADVNHGLGLALFQQGCHKEGIEFIRRAIRVDPSNAEYFGNLGVALLSIGEFDGVIAALSEMPPATTRSPDIQHIVGDALCAKKLFEKAAARYRSAIELGDRTASVWNKLGGCLLSIDRRAEAAAAFREALRINPDSGEAHANLGSAIMDDHPDDAVHHYQRAATLRPDLPHVHIGLGNALAGVKTWDRAIESYRKALHLAPENIEALNGLGNALLEAENVKDAIAVLRRAIEVDPTSYSAHLRLGIALAIEDERSQAIEEFRACLRISPSGPEAAINLASVIQQVGRFDEALEFTQQFLQQHPDDAQMHWFLASLLLGRGDFENGWREYEWRWKWKDFGTRDRKFSQPRWNGEDLNGRTILIHAEQAFGDQIQFVRMVPEVAARGGRVILECEPELMKLFQGFPGADFVIARGETIPPFDVQCPLMSVPGALGITPASIPASIPYLGTDAERIEEWRSTIDGPRGALRVGLVWSGNSRVQGDWDRSMRLETLAELATVSKVKFFALQKGRAGEEAKNPPRGMQLENLGWRLRDFGDTAAVMSLLDLVITTDTSPAHLAGALGRPVWVMLNSAPDWRWMLGREDSPWYPTMRLFRQKSVGNWEEVIVRIAAELTRMTRPTETPI